ncbi:MAG: peptidoglycan DD-metalloendopeptidase family protein [Hyphomicrobiaceae bacterium]|nr:peptidoglycan DD-metalloendopeptidase family protein [Hyphomicrobiaceae bacterium]
MSQQPAPGEAGQRKPGSERVELTDRRAKGAKADPSQAAEERAKLSAQLQEAARSVQASEARLSSIEARRDELEAQKELRQGSLAQRHSSIANLLATMQRMARNPPPVIVTRREDALEMVRSAMLLARAVPELQSQVQDLVGDLQEIDGLIGQITAERAKIDSELPRLRDAQTRLAMLMEKRHSLAEPRELEEIRKEADVISRSAREIGDLIAALDRKVAEKTGLGTYDQELPKAGSGAQELPKAGSGAQELPKAGSGAQAEAGQKPPAAGAAPASQPKPPDKGTQVAIVLTPGTGPLTGPPGRMKPALPFHLAKGQLPSPAHGQRILSFGDTTQNGRKSQGIVIETRHGGQITSPCDGWIVYAGEFRSYGQLLIINAGGGYHVLLAGLSHIDARLGQFILAGEPVGTMTVAAKGKAQDNAPVLYVEFRKEGRPIDPTPWWHDGQQQKVQG